jgi:hypothetical protein
VGAAGAGPAFPVHGWRAEALTFAHPTTRQSVVWIDPGKVGSRLNQLLLELDAGQLYLVGVTSTGPDYDGFGCPIPPYIVFRHDGRAWGRITLSELPTRFSKANLVGSGAERLIRDSKGYLTAAQVQSIVDRMRRDPELEHRGRIDRRIRNPLSMGCSRGAVERIYGAGKYTEWWRTGNWLDKTDEEARRLLHGKREETKP